MKYKLSKFNICLSSGLEKDNAEYVFNTFTRSLVKLPRPIYDTDLSGIKEEDIRTLVSLGIIVDETIDEVETVNTCMDLRKYEQKRLMVTIIPTNACNFRCIYCYQPEKAEVMNEVTVGKILRWFERNLHYFDELCLGWFGGEPLLCPNIMLKLLIGIRDLCKKNGVAMVSSITTNGYLLNIDLFQQLLSNGLLYYQITVDGDETTHNMQRPHKINEDSYSMIMQNLSNMAKLSRHHRFEVGVRINLSGNMRKENIFTFIDRIAEMFAGDKRFVIIWQWVRDWGGSRISQYDTNNLVQTSSACTKYIDYAKSKGLSVADLVSTMTGSDSCEAFYKNGFVIDFAGRVYKCAMCMEDEENNCIGYIDKKGVMQIETSKEMKWLAHDKITEECGSCVYMPMCYTNRCHYSTKIKKTLTCLEYKDLILPQIERMIEKHKYYAVGSCD